MVRESSTLACLALTSAILASFVVPLGSEAAAVASERTVVANSWQEIAVPALPETTVAIGGFATVVQTTVARKVMRIEPPRPVSRARVPVGCDRVISGLVRSAEASQIARCVT